MKVLIGPSTFAKLDQSPLIRLREAGFSVIDNPYKRKLTKEELLELLGRGVSGLIAGLEPLARDVLEKSELKVISRVGSGLSNVDLAAAEELGIRVYSTPDAPTQAVAELTLAAMLNLLRSLTEMNRNLHEGKWDKKIGVQLEGKTIVIIGFGRIGRRVAALLGPFNVKIIAVDPRLDKERKDFETLSLEDALSAADIITIHASGEREILGENEFKLVKKTAFLLNASRGSLINEEALLSALEENRIAGAWLDTFSAEPYSGPLKKYAQVIMTPHAGSYTAECRKIMETEAADNLISAFKEKQ